MSYERSEVEWRTWIVISMQRSVITVNQEMINIVGVRGVGYDVIVFNLVQFLLSAKYIQSEENEITSWIQNPYLRKGYRQ